MAFIGLGVMAALLAVQQNSALRQPHWLHHTGRSISLSWKEEMEGMSCALLDNIDCPGIGGVLVDKRSPAHAPSLDGPVPHREKLPANVD